MILEMDRAARERIAGAINQLARNTYRDDTPHDLTLVFGEDFAVTVVSVPETLRHELFRRVEALGRSRATRSDLGRWLGLGVLGAPKGKLSAMGVLVAPDRVELAERPLG